MSLACLLRSCRPMFEELNGPTERRDGDDGFTLIEMMLVVAVGIILAAMAVPVSSKCFDPVTVCAAPRNVSFRPLANRSSRSLPPEGGSYECLCILSALPEHSTFTSAFSIQN